MNHLTETHFQQLFSQAPTPPNQDSLWNHLNHCDSCLNRLSDWFETHPGHKIQPDDLPPVPGSFRSGLMRRINREENVRTVVTFSLYGLLSAFGLLLKSIFTIGTNTPPRRK